MDQRRVAPRRFYLKRYRDISSMSGVGRVAEGVQFHDGQCCLSWFGRFHNVEILRSVAELEAIHGHEGATKVEWIDL